MELRVAHYVFSEIIVHRRRDVTGAVSEILGFGERCRENLVTHALSCNQNKPGHIGSSGFPDAQRPTSFAFYLIKNEETFCSDPKLR
jgi:hypothetical protein